MILNCFKIIIMTLCAYLTTVVFVFSTTRIYIRTIQKICRYLQKEKKLVIKILQNVITGKVEGYLLFEIILKSRNFFLSLCGFSINSFRHSSFGFMILLTVDIMLSARFSITSVSKIKFNLKCRLVVREKTIDICLKTTKFCVRVQINKQS
jgi:hypothetical protein